MKDIVSSSCHGLNRSIICLRWILAREAIFNCGGQTERLLEIFVTPRVIFWARYVDRFITSPLLLCALSAFAKAEFPVLISLLGADMIMMSCLALGAFVYGPDKYFWWVGALLLFIIMVSQLLSMLAKVEDEKRKEVMRTLTWLTIICWVAYIVLWLLGSEGTAALGLSQEVGLTTVVDLISKAGVLFFLISNMDATDESKATGLTLA